MSQATRMKKSHDEVETRRSSLTRNPLYLNGLWGLEQTSTRSSLASLLATEARLVSAALSPQYNDNRGSHSTRLCSFCKQKLSLPTYRHEDFRTQRSLEATIAEQCLFQHTHSSIASSKHMYTRAEESVSQLAQAFGSQAIPIGRHWRR